MNATVTLANGPSHDVPRTLYGSFVEHMGRCVNGGIWTPDEQSDMFLGGIRQELLDTLSSLRLSVLRYPGGCFADGYHWRDGIGSRTLRPRRKNLAWSKFGRAIGPEEDNHFGTDEFLLFCEAVGSEPMLTVNVGSGTPQEATDWVEYVNGSANTPMGALRGANGHPDPYGVKYWFVGNEIFGPYEVGHLSPKEYVKVFCQFANSMRSVDSSIKLIACGAHYPVGMHGVDLNRMKKINQTVLEGVGDEADYLSIHQYVPVSDPFNFIRFQLLHAHKLPGRYMYYNILGSYLRFRKFLQQCIKDTHRYSIGGKPVPLVLDEWNLWFCFFTDLIQANYNLRDGLWVATILNLLQELATDIHIANVAQLVNCLGIVGSSEHGIFTTPSALVLGLYAKKSGSSYVPTNVDAPMLGDVDAFVFGGTKALPVIDVSTTYDSDRMTIFLVNRHYSESVACTINLGKFTPLNGAVTTRMTHSNPVQYNTVKNPNAVHLETHPSPSPKRSPGGWAYQVTLDPHSLTCLEVALGQQIV